MDIRKPERIYTLEPIEDPVPQKRPEKIHEPDEPQPAPREPKNGPMVPDLLAYSLGAESCVSPSCT